MGRPVTSDLRPVGLTVPPSHCRRTPVWVMSMVALLSRMTGGLTLCLALPQNPWDWVRSIMACKLSLTAWRAALATSATISARIAGARGSRWRPITSTCNLIMS